MGKSRVGDQQCTAEVQYDTSPFAGGLDNKSKGNETSALNVETILCIRKSD